VSNAASNSSVDYIYEVPDLHFIGSSNELNSAYAADGYARVNRTPGCVITTHGVGELSALNGIAGAACEKIPVIHVVGQTSRILQEKKLMIHHSIGTKPDHQLYNKVSKLIRADAAELWEGDKAPAEIDRVLRECVIQSAPVYIFMPLDLHDHRVPASLLETKLDLSPPIDKTSEEAAVSAIVEALSKAREPVIFLDMLVQSFAWKEATNFVDAVKLPFFASHGAKGVVDETHERFAGIYNGPVSTPPGLADVLHNSDQVLSIGWYAAGESWRTILQMLSF
jgi:pyruvate decarboxylase